MLQQLDDKLSVLDEFLEESLQAQYPLPVEYQEGGNAKGCQISTNIKFQDDEKKKKKIKQICCRGEKAIRNDCESISSSFNR